MGGEYFQHRSYPYCNECYIALFIPKCPTCSLPLDEDYVETDIDGDQCFHPHCFCCESCGTPFKDLDMKYFVDEVTQKVYCEAHYEENCSKTCFSCKELITLGEIVNYENHDYHAHCLVCRVCEKELLDEMFFSDIDDDSKFLCEKHYKILSGMAKVCILCFDFITDPEDQFIVGGNKKITQNEEEDCDDIDDSQEDLNEYIHKSCFCCDECSVSLIDQRALRHDDLFYCEAHYAIKVVFIYLF